MLKDEDPKYNEILQQANLLHEFTDGLTNCTQGKANCCEPDIPLTAGDQRQILRALDVRPSLLNIVRKNTQIRPNQCPFLDGNKRCMIYDWRPLICRANTGMFHPGLGKRNDKGSTISLLSSDEIKDDPPVATSVSKMCKDCHKCFVRKNREKAIPRNVVILTAILDNYILTNPGLITMTAFVSKLFTNNNK